MREIQTELGKACFLKAGKFISANDISENEKAGFYPCYGGNGIRGYVDGYTHEGTFPLVGRQGALCGNVNYASGKFHATEHAVVVQPVIDIDVRWLYYKLLAMNLGQYATGAAQPGLAVSTLEKLPITIPERTEQIKTAEILDKVSGLIAMRKKQLQKLDELVKARFVELFGGRNYPQTPLIQLIVDGAGLSYGIIVPGDNVEDGVPMVRPSDFKNDELCLDNVYKVAPEIEAKYARTRLIGDEILVQVIGQPGQIMLSDSRCKGMNVTRNLAVVRPDGNRINRIYLKIYMQTQEAQAFMLGETKQSTLKQLPLGRLKELEVPVPPMELQNQFATFVEQIDKSKLTIQQSLDKLELMKKALMQKYF